MKSNEPAIFTYLPIQYLSGRDQDSGKEVDGPLGVLVWNIRCVRLEMHASAMRSRSESVEARISTKISAGMSPKEVAMIGSADERSAGRS